MKIKISIYIVLFLFLSTSIYSQNIINQLKEFYAHADFDCYERKIQQNVNQFDSLLINLPNDDFILNSYRPSSLDLSKTKNIFIPAVTLVNTESYDFEDNIYDYIRIDSLRSFIIVCVDERLNVLGFTDTAEPGSFIDTKDNFYFTKKKIRKKMQQIIKNINKEKPELIFYCNDYMSSFLYIKEDKIYIYRILDEKSKEFNEEVRDYPDINFIRNMNMMTTPISKEIEENDLSLFYRFTGNTPPEEVRMCPPKTLDNQIYILDE